MLKSSLWDRLVKWSLEVLLEMLCRNIQYLTVNPPIAPSCCAASRRQVLQKSSKRRRLIRGLTLLSCILLAHRPFAISMQNVPQFLYDRCLVSHRLLIFGMSWCPVELQHSPLCHLKRRLQTSNSIDGWPTRLPLETDSICSRVSLTHYNYMSGRLALVLTKMLSIYQSRE